MRSLGLVNETLSVNSNVTPLVKDDEGNRGKIFVTFKKHNLEISFHISKLFFVSYFSSLHRYMLNIFCIKLFDSINFYLSLPSTKKQIKSFEQTKNTNSVSFKY